MTTHKFTISFNGPFRVATGTPSAGFDVTVGDDPIPSSSLKGAMRATARRLLGSGHWLIDEVFGSEGNGSDWAWSSGDFGEDLRCDGRTRIAIDPNTHTVAPHALVRAQHYEAVTATFSVECTGHLADSATANHKAVLVASAMGTQSLGADRNRGFGWVTVSPLDGVDTAELSSEICELRNLQSPLPATDGLGVVL